ncbi:hypothetical protein SAMN05444266_109273 [Chitinophaga jiangningensis]|uniref:Uncharacterized protein n=1 Tax=Chitinophaga jiangningensis TaxID=1419482 RepID=A0A1M7KE77_9BACT|nr:hypothetical protein [Chitinophaga jiangningensis]SHM63551.1 hypothetical protein SAMN05444266_109273 [Chitinophaga jiangningensis]
MEAKSNRKEVHPFKRPGRFFVYFLNSIKVFVLSILFWGCACRNAFAMGRVVMPVGVSISLLLAVGLVVMVLGTLVYLGWLMLGKLGKQLQVANISLLQSEIKEVTYRHRINEATEKCRKLEAQLNQTLFELRKARQEP